MDNVYVFIETTDSAITNITSNHEDVNIAIIERNNLDEKSEQYLDDVLDAPGMLVSSFKADFADCDLHTVWLQIHNEEASMEDE